MEQTEKEMTMWLTYHDDAQIEQYNLKEDDTVRLFKGNNMEVKGESINHLNRFYSEMTTMYWVWKNNKRSKYVGFCHYRRRFTHFMEVEHGECQVLNIANFPFTLFHHYKDAHNYNDYYDIIDILNEKYGENNKYAEYMLQSKTFIPNCCFIMHYDDFVSLCEFFFPILFEFDRRHHLDMEADRYWAKAERDFRYDNKAYQCRAMSFLAERLISCYIVCHMKPFYVNALYG
ncbi:MAG: DUF4422 domain-containing protein [Bacteroidaceae bacterium]|nr:DUF4422 domain-containing protein [Bacteroidaceae bacterium]MDE6000564.1 DUF4422 domain-containing protein [Bacteroidaceae bacterium]